jgi:hypothetical protein
MPMTTILGAVSLSVAIAIFLVATHLSFHRWGYRKGQRDSFEAGYLAGRKDIDNWWMKAEAEVDEVRVKIWREEARL